MKLSIKLFAFAALILAAGYFVGFKPFSNGGCTPGGGYYKPTGATPVYTGVGTKVMGTNPDTFKMSLGCVPNSITFSNTLLQTGVVTPTVTTTVTGQLWASADGGNNYATITSGTFTTTVTNTVTPVVEVYPISSANGTNPYTNYWWIITGVAHDTVTATGSVLIR